MGKERGFAELEGSGLTVRHLSARLLGRRMLAVYLLCALLSACASMGGAKPTDEDLMAAATKFNDALRWQNFKTAAVFVDRKQQEAYWSSVDKISDKLRMTEYEIRNVSRESPTYAVVLVRCTYFLLSDPRIKPVTLHQRWHYEEENKTWTVTHPDIEVLVP